MSVRIKFRYFLILISALAIYYMAKNGVWVSRIVSDQQNNAVEIQSKTNEAYTLDSNQGEQKLTDSSDNNNAKRHFPSIQPTTSTSRPLQQNLTITENEALTPEDAGEPLIESDKINTNERNHFNTNGQEKIKVAEKDYEEVWKSLKFGNLLNEEDGESSVPEDTNSSENTNNSSNIMQLASNLPREFSEDAESSEIDHKIQNTRPLQRPIQIQKIEEQPLTETEKNINQTNHVATNEHPTNGDNVSQESNERINQQNQTEVVNNEDLDVQKTFEPSPYEKGKLTDASNQGVIQTTGSPLVTAISSLNQNVPGNDQKDNERDLTAPDDIEDMFVIEESNSTDGSVIVDSTDQSTEDSVIKLSKGSGDVLSTDNDEEFNKTQSGRDTISDIEVTKGAGKPYDKLPSRLSESDINLSGKTGEYVNTLSTSNNESAFKMKGKTFSNSVTAGKIHQKPSPVPLQQTDSDGNQNTFTNSITILESLKKNIVQPGAVVSENQPKDLSAAKAIQDGTTSQETNHQKPSLQTPIEKEEPPATEINLEFSDMRPQTLVNTAAFLSPVDGKFITPGINDGLKSKTVADPTIIKSENTVKLVKQDLPSSPITPPIKAVDEKIISPEINEDTEAQSNLDENCEDSIHSVNQPTTHGHCLFYSEYFNTCDKGKKYYPKNENEKELKCKSKQYKDLCHFNQKTVGLKCNTKNCAKGTLKVGIFNKKTGHFDYLKVENAKNLILVIRKEMSKWNRFAPFIFVSCKARFPQKERIRQILTFPEPHKPKKNQPPIMKQPNINILVIDSLSRQHFYRMLPKTVKSLRNINKASKNPYSVTEALDFKGMQSLAPFTYVNIHALMNGTIDRSNYKRSKNYKRDYPIQKLFAAFRMKGYRTLLQEDSCWHDKWGSLLSGNEKIQDSKSKKVRKELWVDIQDTITKWGVHDLGLTHMTCEALKKYGMTSLFDTHRMLCMNGRSISSYFIDYLIQRAVDSLNTDPLLSYTHINFGHEKTGRRIKALDNDISRLVRKLEHKENTITLIISDHGGKQSKYSINTIPGRYEVYDSLMFMVVPKALKQQIGDETYTTLKTNQNSLITVLDIRDTFIKLLNLKNIVPNSLHEKSLFSTALAERRDCQDIGIRKYALCKCLSNINLLSPKADKYKDFLVWLGEYAVGQINNKISGYLTGKDTIAAKNPRCTRIQAEKIRLVIEEQNQNGVVYTFDIMTKKQGPEYDIFNFRIYFNSKRMANTSLVEILTWTRISMYQKYQYCHDRDVPLDLCICTGKSRFKTSNQTSLTHYHQFGNVATTRSINGIHCLLLLQRDNVNVVTFEVLNLCERKVLLVFNVKTILSWQVSQRLPIEMTIYPQHIKFAATFLKGLVTINERIEPVLIVKWE
ncbi:uncharacterized protein [Clytia hemisphaerica]|uniref:Uncharacterized protein n=1 Tax=Clytia hemisphaerica TaxID=252671 RepID=A0A7M5XAX2_9CNID